MARASRLAWKVTAKVSMDAAAGAAIEEQNGGVAAVLRTGAGRCTVTLQPGYLLETADIIKVTPDQGAPASPIVTGVTRISQATFAVATDDVNGGAPAAADSHFQLSISTVLLG